MHCGRAGQTTAAGDPLSRVGLDIGPGWSLVAVLRAPEHDGLVHDRCALETAQPGPQVLDVLTHTRASDLPQHHALVLGSGNARLEPLNGLSPRRPAPLGPAAAAPAAAAARAADVDLPRRRRRLPRRRPVQSWAGSRVATTGTTAAAAGALRQRGSVVAGGVVPHRRGRVPAVATATVPAAAVPAAAAAPVPAAAGTGVGAARLASGLADVLDGLGVEAGPSARGARQLAGRAHRDRQVAVEVLARGVGLDRLGERQVEGLVDQAPLGHVVPVDERHRDAGLARATGAADAVQEGALLVGALVVDDVRDVLTSMPRAATSVATSTSILPLRNARSACSRALAEVAVDGCGREAAVGCMSAATLSQVRLVRQNTIVSPRPRPAGCGRASRPCPSSARGRRRSASPGRCGSRPAPRRGCASAGA